MPVRKTRKHLNRCRTIALHTSIRVPFWFKNGGSIFEKDAVDTGRSWWPGQDVGTLDELLREIEDSRKDQPGEDDPTPSAIHQAKILISGAKNLIGVAPPTGELDYYYGELGVEWRKGNRILRLTCFGDTMSPRLDYGTMSKSTPGEYKSDPAADAKTLATRLDWLSQGQRVIAAKLG